MRYLPTACSNGDDKVSEAAVNWRPSEGVRVSFVCLCSTRRNSRAILRRARTAPRLARAFAPCRKQEHDGSRMSAPHAADRVALAHVARA
jgi:hypothetical protein